MPIRPDLHRSVDSQKFDDLARRYHHYWSEDDTHLGVDDHMKIRMALGKVLQGVSTDGMAVFCGTGPEIAHNRDLDSTLLGVFLEKYPELVLSDFSQDTLQASFRTIAGISNTVAARSRLVIRDFSHGNLSSKFDSLMRERIAGIRTVSDMDAFVSFVREEVDIHGIEKQPLPDDYGAIDPRLVSKVDTQQGLHFERITKTGKPIRLIVANLLISGMFAVTEMDFRRKLNMLRKKYPREMTEEKFVTCLSVWQELILLLNNKAGQDFVGDTLCANENIDSHVLPTVFLSADDTVTYTGIESFRRVDVDGLRRKLPARVHMHQVDQTLWDHSHEDIPHTHRVSVCVFEAQKKSERAHRGT